MHEQAALDCHEEHGQQVARRGGELDLADRSVQRRLQRVIADLADPGFHNVQRVERNSSDRSCRVVNAEDELAATSVGERSQLVGDVVPARRRDARTRDGDLLEFQCRVTQADAPCKISVARHGAALPQPVNVHGITRQHSG